MRKERPVTWVAAGVGIVCGVVGPVVGSRADWSAKPTWALPDGYTADLDGSMLTLYDWGTDCDLPLRAEILWQDGHAVTVAVQRHDGAGRCGSSVVLHEVHVSLAAPIGDRTVIDRSGLTIPGRASRADAEAYGALQKP